MNNGVSWRKRNDKVITFDIQKPIAGSQFHKTTGSTGTFRERERESPLNSSMQDPRIQQGRFAAEREGYNAQPEITVNNRRGVSPYDDDNAQGSVLGRGPFNSMLGGGKEGAGVSDCKPELIAKMLQLLAEVGNTDFDESDLQTQDAIVKRAEIVRKGIASMKSDAKRANEMQRKYEEAARELERKDKELEEEREGSKRKSLNQSQEGGRVSEQVKQVENLEKELASANAANRSKDQEIQQKNDQIGELRKEIKTKDETIIEINRTKKEVEKKGDELEREKSILESKEADLERREGELKKQNDELKREIEGLKKKIFELEEEKKKLIQKIEDQEVEQKRRAREVQEEKDKLEKEIKELKDKLNRIEKANSEKDSILGKLASQIMELNRTRTQIDDK